MTTQPNIGQAFPLEKLASDIARNQFNYQAILNGINLWDRTTQDTITVRLATEVAPFFQTFTIDSRQKIESQNTPTISIKNVGLGTPLRESALNILLYGGSHGLDLQPNQMDLGHAVTFNILVENNPGSLQWNLFYLPLITDWSPKREFRYSNLVRDITTSSNLVYRVNAATISSNPSNQAPHLDTARYTDPITEDEALTPLRVPTVDTFTSSLIARWSLTQDISKFILKTESTDSVAETDITVKVNVRF